MDTSVLTSSGPTVNTPSDLSYSSGASRTSTRNTSPDSVSVASCHSSPLLDFNLTVDIEHTPNTLLDPQAKMDRNPFQSVNERRNKLVTERSGTTSQFSLPQPLQPQQPQQHHQEQQQHQQHQQNQQNQQQQLASLSPQTLRSGVQPLCPPRSLTSANWRANTIDEMSPQGRTMYSPFGSPSGHHMQHGSVRPTSYPSPRQDNQQLHVGMASYPSLGTSIFSDAQLDTSYAYCYDRGNGQYTRLIPADMLPPLRDVPAMQQSCSGMVILPQPRALPPNGCSSNTQPILFRSAPTTPSSPSDTIQAARANARLQQSRIDNIVASTPPTPTHHQHPSSNTSGGPSGGGAASAGGGLASSQHAPGGGQRRPKIYCDKWVHEGVCAFTQQGCKYKHEMPFDKVTQHQLGLFHGFPAWWKKHQADLARQREMPLVEGSGSNAGGGGGGMVPSEEARLSSERYLGRGGPGPGPGPGPNVSNIGGGAANASGGGGVGAGAAADMGGTRGSGLCGDPSGQLGWRHGSEQHNSESQPLGPVPSTTTNRGGVHRGGVNQSLRNPIVSYGSPFGPIAPPNRGATSTATTAVTTTTAAGTTESNPSHQGQGGQAGGGGNSTSQSHGRGGGGGILTANNPYASLEALDENSGGCANDNERGSTSTNNISNGARLT